MDFFKRKALIPFYLWALCLSVILATRPVWPTIETRALTVAWEMLARHDFLTITLNFAPYSHKPPLLAWLINFFWAIFGVNKFGATLVPFFATTACAALTALLAKNLWSDNAQKAALMPWLFFGSGIALLYGSVIFYDMLLVVFVLTGCLSLLAAIQEKKYAWLFFGLSLGLGGLTKGPVILLHLLPLALLAPFWAPQKITARWYGGILIGVLIGFAVALSWAIPAAIKGGPEYAHMIFWGQSAGRMAKSFDHAEPFWFYLMVAPAFFVPWLFFTSVWKKIDLKNLDWQGKFLASWIVPVFIFFSLISGKQLHYLLPLLPAFLLCLAPRLEKHTRTIPFITGAVIAIVILVHLAGAATKFSRFDLQPLAKTVAAEQDTITYVGNAYEGDFGYLGRLTHPLAIAGMEERPKIHGKIVMCLRPHDRDQYFKHWRTRTEMPYRGNRVCGVYEPPKKP